MIGSKTQMENLSKDMNAKLLMSTTAESNYGTLQKQPVCKL